jgi:uncharacterized repeat protein (TIGR01451 family)
MPRIGDHIIFTITLKNETNNDISNIAVWDTLPPEVRFLSTGFTDAPLIQDGQYIGWDISYKEGDPDPFILHPGQTETIVFEVEIIAATVNKDPIMTTAWVDYSDGYYFPGGPFGDKHEPVPSEVSFYPLGRMIVFPNPYNPAKGDLKFFNVVPGSIIDIWTLSGEHVDTIEPAPARIKAYWDGKNWRGYEVSAGIYLFTVKNTSTSGAAMRGKIFVVKK